MPGSGRSGASRAGWCSAIGLFIAALSERSIWVEKVWFPVSYIYIALSGCFYMAFWLPEPARKFVQSVSQASSGK